jgi:hypothetical protein
MSNQQLFSPYRGINLQHLSDASVCYPGNPVSSCVNFTPNTNIKTMSSNVYHGEVGRGGAVSIERGDAPVLQMIATQKSAKLLRSETVDHFSSQKGTGECHSPDDWWAGKC